MSTPAKPRPTGNEHDTREGWLRAAMSMLAPMFNHAGSPLPDLRRASIGFTSKGGKGNCVGQCWHATASADAHFEIFIRPDKADPVEVLGILTHELVHAAVPLGSGHGKVYRDLALKVGLEGKMREAMPGMHLAEKLRDMAADLGPLPHATLDLTWRESAPRKPQKTNMLKAYCQGGPGADGGHEECDYIVRLTKLHAERGAPLCGIHETRMVIEWPEEAEPEEGDTEQSTEADARFKAPPSPLSGSGDSMPSPLPRRAARPGFAPHDPARVYAPGHTFIVDQATGKVEASLSPADDRTG